MHLPHTRIALLATAMLALCCASPLHAALGGPASGLLQQGQVVTGPGHQLSQGVRQQTVLTPQNVTITEYSAGGIVFAVRWEGPVIPDPQPLLGSYFPEYATSRQVRAPMGRNAPVQIRSQKLVVHMQGHMRAYMGTAYAPALVPAGLSLNSLGIEP